MALVGIILWFAWPEAWVWALAMIVYGSLMHKWGQEWYQMEEHK